jgi:protein-tyrosine phosphatase
MDRSNYLALKNLAKQSKDSNAAIKVELFLDYSQQQDFSEVPDPYYGGENGFNLVIDLIEDASHGLIKSMT